MSDMGTEMGTAASTILVFDDRPSRLPSVRRRWKIIKRVGGSVIGGVLTFLALADAPSQWAGWKAVWHRISSWPGIDWPAFWTGNGGRFVLIIVAVLVGLWAWDVPKRIRRRPGFLAAAQQANEIAEISDGLSRILAGVGRSSIGGAMSLASGLAQRLTVEAEVHEDGYKAMTAAYLQSLVSEPPRLTPSVSDESAVTEQELADLVAKWVLLLDGYENLVMNLQWTFDIGKIDPWSLPRYAEWRDHDRQFWSDLKPFAQIRRCEALNRFKNVAQDPRKRPPRPPA